jgi:hypothetical protein
MLSSLPKLRRRWIALGLAVLAVVVSLLASRAFQWSPLNCWHEDIDINSGRVRHTRFLLYCQIGDRTEETWLSRAYASPSYSPDWRRVNTFSPFVRYSPHYRYHGAIHQVEILRRCDELVPFESDARRKAAHRLLVLWQKTGSYFDADRYLQEIETVVSRLHRDGASIVKANDLPDG